MPLLVTTLAVLAFVGAPAAVAPGGMPPVALVARAPHASAPLAAIAFTAPAARAPWPGATAAVWAAGLVEARTSGVDGLGGLGFADVIVWNRVVTPVAAFPRRGIVAGVSMRW